MARKWENKSYNSLNYFLRNKFGEKVFKISLDAGFTCPNRDGKVGKGGCIFCSARGSGDFTGTAKSLTHQFEEVKSIMEKKWKSGKYIGYFQAYTNTYAPAAELKKKYEEILNIDDVVGIAIATRPDCLDDDVLEVLHEISKKKYLWVELGLQTIHEDTAKLINRGHNLESFIDGVKKLRKLNIDVVAHIIYGLPYETREMMMETIDFVANSPIQGIKLHLLHVMKGTQLENVFYEKGFDLLEMDQYINIIVDSVERLPENIVIHRLTGDSPRDLLIGPMWSLKKWEVLNAIDKEFDLRGSYQGKNYSENTNIKSMFY
ncbi:TIGR01212 family radical SAM protein [Clostridium cylindrosporum]|uniref:Radical SAM protein, TIGR01212 family n=1 Tax=Clostridium cylindrosporum DSM 605 TaxID=1121307 RepID=A0A0J8D4V6_CLOCY|nr:TIGR01212 family radical SAM protein [Clostridium cylindrosporum]KMT21195.1 radical SAM protein, TIGR01212 family [Clostridium cylindrosporum DSM 605]